ncbi:Protein argonaute-2 [Trametes pubescens]|uniref:Protein argonaute-2 n=1 Tax=Trametes pubescens TaxID=154538 RepID=A0A1M2VMY0_TRAPU|nr:Protein argonaute-2 [Trametes pubescens]
MREAGMSVKTDSAMSIPGLVIAPPKIRYRNDEMRIAPRAGSWNVVGKQFIQPGVLNYWGVAVFDRTARDQDVLEFVSRLVGNLKRAGLVVANPSPPIRPGNPANPGPTLMEVATLGVNAGPPPPPKGTRYPQLIIVILPNAAPDCRRAVKHWGDIQRNISTQCVRSPKWRNANDQYCNNVALKINARIGGTNSVIMSEATSFLQTCMVVGADVGHPGPGAATRPSVAGLVASVDPAISKMTSYAHVQAPRTEIIEGLETMIVGALTDYQEYYRLQNKKTDPPKTMVFYRDGVSEGEFAQVAAREIPMVKSAFRKCHIPDALMPKLIFIVVGKRHHIRFFPQNPARDGDRSGNCPAGLLVHQTITNPNYPDFYLQSHAGLLGSESTALPTMLRNDAHRTTATASRPAHYVVLENEAGLSSIKYVCAAFVDMRIPALTIECSHSLQTLTFHLCHMYASATRSVSIPAPVYCECSENPRICSRMEFHCEDGASLSDTASNVTSAKPEFNLEQWKAAFKPTALNKRMYFL